MTALLLALLLSMQAAQAGSDGKRDLMGRLTTIRTTILELEGSLLESLRTQEKSREDMKRVRQLMKLQKQERALGQARLADLERTIKELEARREILNARIKSQQRSLKKILVALDRSIEEQQSAPPIHEGEGARARLEAPRRKVLANLVDRGLKEVTAYKIDLADAERLEARIQEERHHLTYLFQDLKERESILELNRQLQADMLARKRNERLDQLQSYRRLKSSEAQLENLIGEFNARMEVQRSVEAEREAARALKTAGVFARLKGKLSLPIAGRVVSGFGRSYDSKSRLFIFKKGIDIAAGKNQPVTAVAAGKVVYSGELPDYGRVAIIDHGEHFYSLCAHLGELARKAGEAVMAGDPLGATDESGTPVYFEIRARNIPVNPLQWVSN